MERSAINRTSFRKGNDQYSEPKEFALKGPSFDTNFESLLWHAEEDGRGSKIQGESGGRRSRSYSHSRAMERSNAASFAAKCCCCFGKSCENRERRKKAKDLIEHLKLKSTRASKRATVTDEDEIAIDEKCARTGESNVAGGRGVGGKGPTKRKFENDHNFDKAKQTMDQDGLTKALIGRPTKKQKLTNNIQAQAPADLPTLNPQPIRLNYEPHPLDDQSDEWFMGMFRKLYAQAERFVVESYGVHDIDRGAFFEPWACSMSPEFISWAESVAEPDPATGGWDNMLRNTEQRQWFVMGILMKIIEKKIFSEELFGANEQQRELLHGLDRALFQREGNFPFLILALCTNRR